VGGRRRFPSHMDGGVFVAVETANWIMAEMNPPFFHQLSTGEAQRLVDRIGSKRRVSIDLGGRETCGACSEPPRWSVACAGAVLFLSHHAQAGHVSTGGTCSAGRATRTRTYFRKLMRELHDQRVNRILLG